jgi:hypothetical protein
MNDSQIIKRYTVQVAGCALQVKRYNIQVNTIAF